MIQHYCLGLEPYREYWVYRDSAFVAAKQASPGGVVTFTDSLGGEFIIRMDPSTASVPQPPKPRPMPVPKSGRCGFPMLALVSAAWIALRKRLWPKR
jgi:hypothetical protein